MVYRGCGWGILGALSAVSLCGCGLYGGVVSSGLGDKPAGRIGTTTIPWDQAFAPGFGGTVQIVVKEPPKEEVAALEAGDTLVILNGVFQSFAGLDPGEQFSNMTLLGGWIEGRTFFNPLGSGSRNVRPYLQYGVGMTLYSAVTRDGSPSWGSTAALSLRSSLGLEARWGKFGWFVDVGVERLGEPNTDPVLSGAQALLNAAQDLVLYPFSLGLMWSF